MRNNSQLLILSISFLTILFLNKKMRGTYFDAFFFVVAPYVVLILINNLFMKKYGFFIISDTIIRMHIIALFVFYCGTCLGNWLSYRIKHKKNKESFYLPSRVVRRASRLLLICEIIVIIDSILRLRRYGLSNFINGGETYGSSSIAAHLSRLIVPLIILLFDYYCENKRKETIILVLIGMALLFSTFIKYHIVSAILSIFIYTSIKRPFLVKKIGIITIGAIVILFISNYVLSFKANNDVVSRDFYFLHLWQYIAGGTINIDNVISGSKYSYGNQFSLFLWIIEMVTSFPSMITNRIFGFKFTKYVFSEMLPFYEIGGKSVSNVVSIPGAAYIQSDIIGLCIFSFINGILVQYFYMKARRTRSISYLMTVSIFLSFCMLSFFSSFFELPGPWENMIWSVIIFPILKMRIKNKRIIV